MSVWILYLFIRTGVPASWATGGPIIIETRTLDECQRVAKVMEHRIKQDIAQALCVEVRK